MNTHFIQIIRCPDCHSSELSVDKKSNTMLCSSCSAIFPMLMDKPVLIRHDNEVFPLSAYSINDSVTKKPGSSIIKKLLPSNSVNLSNIRSLRNIVEAISKIKNAYVLVVGGGAQRTWLDDRFKSFPNIHLIYCDIDITALIDCYCDAHELPFIDGCFDGVITTAVLEHVLYPEKVAAEIFRVLKIDGLLYSELPFMQQVHEGAYDFTRYTLSGHRRLFNRFFELESGMVAGPGTALAWSIENFFMAFSANYRSRLIIKGIMRLMTFWVKYFDYFLKDRPQAMDAASCTYFFGRKHNSKVPDKEIIDRYVGHNHHRHI